MNNYPLNIIKLFINAKTDINQKDIDNRSPLLHSITNKYPINIIKLFINEKTDINQKDDYFNDSPLMCSLYNKSL